MKRFKIASIVGARPQFIKMALVSEALQEENRLREISVHTGQHYDYRMSALFYKELKLPRPDYHLKCGSGSHGAQTGKMMAAIEKVLQSERPDLVLVYGDTNTTLAGVLAAAKLCFPVAHVEAGLRSYNRSMPEEINRMVTDKLATLLFCPTSQAVENLAKEGICQGVFLVGDVMIDMLRRFESVAESRSNILKRLNLTPRRYFVTTLHRPVNADETVTLRRLLGALQGLDHPVVFPVHPRTQKQIERLRLRSSSGLRLMEPVGYFDMLLLEKYARAILTDSGGVQKEAYHFQVPCLTLREETEWVETVESGWNRLVGSDPGKIQEILQTLPQGRRDGHLFGEGDAARRIAKEIRRFLAAERRS